MVWWRGVVRNDMRGRSQGCALPQVWRRSCCGPLLGSRAAAGLKALVLRTLIRVARPLSGSRAVAGLEPLVLRPRPHRSYAGHEADVLDVAWSRSQFLLSASMDKTVRLWHISMDDCLRVFRRVPDP